MRRCSRSVSRGPTLRRTAMSLRPFSRVQFERLRRIFKTRWPVVMHPISRHGLRRSACHHRRLGRRSHAK
jgi:hypothetical protein